MKNFILLLLLVSGLSIAQSNYDEGCFEITRISLTIEAASREKVIYLYRPKIDSGECLIEIREDKDGKETVRIKKYMLGEESNIPKAFSDALNFDLRDQISLHDGTRWTIRSDLYQEFEISISTPEYMTEERGYNELLKFRDFLDKELIGEGKP